MGDPEKIIIVSDHENVLKYTEEKFYQRLGAAGVSTLGLISELVLETQVDGMDHQVGRAVLGLSYLGLIVSGFLAADSAKRYNQLNAMTPDKVQDLPSEVRLFYSRWFGTI